MIPESVKNIKGFAQKITQIVQKKRFTNDLLKTGSKKHEAKIGHLGPLGVKMCTKP